MLAGTKSATMKPCNFYCEGHTCRFGEYCRYLHDDSIRASAIEKKKFAVCQIDDSVSQKKRIIPKQNDNPAKPVPFVENNGYTTIIQDWDLAANDFKCNQRDFDVTKPHNDSTQIVQLKETNAQKLVTDFGVSSFLSQRQQESKSKAGSCLKNNDSWKEGKINDGQAYESSTSFTSIVLFPAHNRSHWSDASSKEKFSPSPVATQKNENHQHQRYVENQPTNAYRSQSRWPKRTELRAQKFNLPAMLSGWMVKQHEECRWTRDALNNMKVISASLPTVRGPIELQRLTMQERDFTTRPAKKPSREGLRRLPVELRLIVWKFALQDGVHASVVMKGTPGTRSQLRDPSEMSWGNDTQIEGPYTFIRRYAQPALLHVCRETRKLALEHYQLSFQSKIFFNYATDVIHLHSTQPDDIRRFVHTCASEKLHSIQRLALNLRDTHVDNFVPLIRKFTGLKHLIIQFSYDDSEEYRGNREMIIETAHLIRLDLKAGGKSQKPHYRALRVQVVPPEHVEFP